VVIEKPNVAMVISMSRGESLMATAEKFRIDVAIHELPTASSQRPSRNPTFVPFEDSALIQRILAGQPECFAILMDRHVGAVRKRVRSMVRNPSDVEDVLQETVFKVWRFLPTFRAECSFRTWMTRVATNEAFQLHRKVQRRRVYQAPSDRDLFASTGELQDESLIRAEVTSAVRGAVAGLPPKYRQVLVLCYFQDLSAREVAQRLHLTVPGVKTQLFRARCMLRAAIQDRACGG
jgi:RNA polymerase sigma-70 factor (ECF subfamily)